MAIVAILNLQKKIYKSLLKFTIVIWKVLKIQQIFPVYKISRLVVRTCVEKNTKLKSQLTWSCAKRSFSPVGLMLWYESPSTSSLARRVSAWNHQSRFEFHTSLKISKASVISEDGLAGPICQIGRAHLPIPFGMTTTKISKDTFLQHTSHINISG